MVWVEKLDLIIIQAIPAHGSKPHTSTEKESAMNNTATKYGMVTGASSGIGKACALALLQAGWHLVLVGRREGLLDDVVTLAKQQGYPGQAQPMVADVADDSQVARLFDAVKTRFTRLDLLFNNAGIFVPGAEPHALSAEDWRRVVDVNLNGMFYCLSAAYGLMRSQSPQGGRIINNGSISAHTPRPGSIAYTTTKHAITGLTKAANLDGRAHHIAVGQIDIGNVASDLTAQMAQGILQADGSVRAEARMDMAAVVQTFMAMVNLPLSANVLQTTVMATQMPFVGRG
jgi:NAD(P)-dependent dehydrogenase (short-subunit alcohol dehydrogenase family)